MNSKPVIYNSHQGTAYEIQYLGEDFATGRKHWYLFEVANAESVCTVGILINRADQYRLQSWNDFCADNMLDLVLLRLKLALATQELDNGLVANDPPSVDRAYLLELPKHLESMQAAASDLQAALSDAEHNQ